MRTLHMLFIPKRKLSKREKVEWTYLLRIRSFLLRDLLPSLIILIIISMCASLVAKRIHQAKNSRSQTLSMVDESAQKKTPSLQGSLKPEEARHD